MFERFTERARQVVVLAQDEARHMKHDEIATEHLLLGLLREEDGIAARVLGELDVTADRVRRDVLNRRPPADEQTTGQIPFTPRAKKTLENSMREALSLGHNYIATEHILLALLRDQGCGGEDILVTLTGATPDAIRDRTVRMLTGDRRAAREKVTQGQGKLDAKTDEQISRASSLVTTLAERGFPAELRTYLPRGHRPISDPLNPHRMHVRVTVVWDTLNADEIQLLTGLGIDAGYVTEFSRKHGMTFRPKEDSQTTTVYLLEASGNA